VAPHRQAGQGEHVTIIGFENEVIEVAVEELERKDVPNSTAGFLD